MRENSNNSENSNNPYVCRRTSQGPADFRWLPAYPISVAQCRRALTGLSHPFTVNFVIFFLLSLITFRRNHDFLYFGDDGKFEVTLIEQFPVFVPPLIGFTSDMLRGLGNVFFPVNPYWIPAYFLPVSWQGEYSNFALTYALCAGELFVATYVATRLVQLPSLVGILAAWLVPLVIMPYFGFGLISHTAAAFPHYATIVAISTVLAAISSILGERPLAASAALGIILFLGASFVAVVAPTFLIFGVPLALVSAILCCIDSSSRNELILKVSIFALVGVLCLGAYGFFVLGLFLETAAGFFNQLSVMPPRLQNVSMLFWIPSPLFNVPRCFVAGGLIGAALVACSGKGIARRAAISLLVTEAGLLAIGGLHLVHPFWYGPALWYFEGFLFCYLSIFLIAGLFVVARVIFIPTVAAFWAARTAYARRPAIYVPRSLVGFVIAGLMVILILHQGNANTPGPFFVSYPQSETPITKILKEEISLRTDRRFRGRAADFIGRSLPESNDFQIWHYLRYLAEYQTGNTHGAIGLWQDAIPTLIEYSPQMTPAYFAFMRRFFTRPGDEQTRNRVEMRQINPRMLAAVGVRFVITDGPVENELQLRSRIAIQAPDSLIAAFGAPPIFRNHNFSLDLYEVPNVNVGQYSPVTSLQANDAADILRVLDSPEFDPRRTAVTNDGVPEDLVPAELEDFSIGRGNVHVRASSPGRSLLLLPIEFSRCLSITVSPTGASAPAPHLMRADLVLTGLLFERVIDADIAYFTGPFSNSRCRLQDRAESTQISLHNAFRDQPEFLPRRE